MTNLSLEQAERIAVRLAWGDLMGIDDPEFPGYPFAAVEFRKTLPDDMQDAVEDALVYVYHNEQTPPHLAD